MSKPPKANRTSAVTTAVTTICRPTARCVAASKCFVFSRNGTSAIFGPIPISKSRRSFVTSSKLITEKSNENPLSRYQASGGAIYTLTAPQRISISATARLDSGHL